MSLPCLLDSMCVPGEERTFERIAHHHSQRSRESRRIRPFLPTPTYREFKSPSLRQAVSDSEHSANRTATLARVRGFPRSEGSRFRAHPLVGLLQNEERPQLRVCCSSKRARRRSDASRELRLNYWINITPAEILSRATQKSGE
jgi:hypothetical protein